MTAFDYFESVSIVVNRALGGSKSTGSVRKVTTVAEAEQVFAEML